MNDFWLKLRKLTKKELLSIFRDKMMFLFILYSFTVSVYMAASVKSTDLHSVPIAFVDEDRSHISRVIIDGFFEPHFKRADLIELDKASSALDSGEYTFVVILPKNLQKDISSAKAVDIAVNIDATRISQAGIGAGYIANIIGDEIAKFLHIRSDEHQIQLILNYKYNPNLDSSYFASINQVVGNIMMLSILLAGASFMREREHGSIEHLMVMPLRSVEIVLSKIFATTIIILLSSAFSLLVVVDLMLSVPLSGSVMLFLVCGFFMLFATSSMGIFMATMTSSMPQFGMMLMLVVLPLLMLSGGSTPYESMPIAIQYLMYLSPTTHFMELSQAILFRGATVLDIYKSLLSIIAIGGFFFIFTLMAFQKAVKSKS